MPTYTARNALAASPQTFSIETETTLTTFAETGLPDRALKAVRALGCDEPTPVQEQVKSKKLSQNQQAAASRRRQTQARINQESI